MLLAELVREVLGPRSGPREELDLNPLDEYLTGVLQPAELITAPEPEGIDDRLPEEAEPGEEDLEEPQITPVVFSPVLDPRRRPSSMGLSFRVSTGTDRPQLRICVSWARYFRRRPEQNGQTTGRPVWVREPRVRVLECAGSQDFWLSPEGTLPGPGPEAEVSLHALVTPEDIEPGAFRVLLQLVNRIRPRTEGQLRTEECIFQPSIRVVCGPGTGLQAARVDPGPLDEEDERLDFLYRDRPVMARGHLVSALWREIDPERPGPPGAERPGGPPFEWVDGILLDEESRELFTCPDVRTEFVPVLAVGAPDWDWDPQAGPGPELDARTLSDMTPGQLHRALEPLVSGYRTWLDRQRQAALQLSGRDREIALRLLGQPEAVLRRMQAGLGLLQADPDVYLAFTFACRAVALQAEWAGHGRLRWRPFQLAFILMNLESIAKGDSPDREVCDLLWVPTGSGKTEAYLGLIAFTLALRRRRALARREGDRTGGGVAVISRYTLRLLTIQQFRRALGMVTACEFLRVCGLKSGGPVGWRPRGWPDRGDFLWGSVPFRAGLWVGGNLTPNRLETIRVQGERSHFLPGALKILEGQHGEGEPAQVLSCPACGALLAIPEENGLEAGSYRLHLTIRQPPASLPPAGFPPGPGFTVPRHQLDSRGSLAILTLELNVTGTVDARVLDSWWQNGPGITLQLACFRASRPGYFPLSIPRAGQAHGSRTVDFEIWCPNPGCPLATEWWCEGVPADAAGLADRQLNLSEARGRNSVEHPLLRRLLQLPDGMVFRTVPDWWRTQSSHLACRVPVPALTVDEQLYRRLPGLVVATMDKFARLPFLPEAAALFGSVDSYEPERGYHRRDPAQPAGRGVVPVPPPDPPGLILQDELHLIGGPLGSLAGLYEVAVDFLCTLSSGGGAARPKYVAATATVREAGSQVLSLFDRDVLIFPPPGLRVGDRFFIRALAEPHPLEDQPAGQLYAGICAPGRGPLTPVSRIWACLLQQTYRLQQDPDAGFFWTLTGYFNAIRELAGALALYRQDIPERVRKLSPGDYRRLAGGRTVELSSRMASTGLPAALELLGRDRPAAPDALFATSMFGTGVDVPRLSLMVVHGQPKTTSAYIQATGRVGRRRGALVVTFLRASRPRDLSHYEFFAGYHRQLHRHVEPVTVMPFSPGALDAALGPVMVAILRHLRGASHPWHLDGTAADLPAHRSAPEVRQLSQILKARAKRQPPARRPAGVGQLAESGLDRWASLARKYGRDLVWVEYAIGRPPQKPVVLGDPDHSLRGLPVVFEEVPQSMREVEPELDIQV
jgi:hypothetical protein